MAQPNQTLTPTMRQERRQLVTTLLVGNPALPWSAVADMVASQLKQPRPSNSTLRVIALEECPKVKPGWKKINTAAPKRHTCAQSGCRKTFTRGVAYRQGVYCPAHRKTQAQHRKDCSYRETRDIATCPVCECGHPLCVHEDDVCQAMSCAGVTCKAFRAAA